MGKKFQQQIRVVSRDKIRSSTTVIEAAFFDDSGNPIEIGGAATITPAAHVAAISTADATDEATAVTLVNEVKATVNDLISSLEAGGFLAED